MSDILYSRSQAESMERCPRESWYRYYSPNGTPTPGWQAKEPPLALTLGSCGHRGMQVLFELGSNVDQAVEAAHAEWDKLTSDDLPQEGRQNPSFFISEQKALLEAFLRAWRVTHWDSFNNQYAVVSIEREGRARTPRGPVLQLRCDLVLRERETGLLWVPDWKFVKDGRDWGTKWGMEPQTWSQVWGTSQVLGEPVAGAIYWGFIKGDRRDGRQLSPLIHLYKREIRPGVWEYDTEYHQGKGWARQPVWENEDFGSTPSERVRYWVNWLPEEVRGRQFVVSPPIMRDEALQEEWVDRSSRAVQNAHGMEMDHFPPHRSSWNCKKCVYRAPCYGTMEWEDAVGGMSPRVDHHGVEGEE